MTMEVKLQLTEKKIHGIRVAHIHSPNSLLSYIAFFGLSGSFAEDKKLEGIAHFTEHMFFKGTEKRNCQDIKTEAALLGANWNASTGNYHTCYHMTIPAINQEETMELLCDLMFNSTFPEEEIKKECKVIQEERKMYEDDPESYFLDKLAKHFCRNQVGHPIAGTRANIDSFKQSDFIFYRDKMYGLNNTLMLVVSPSDSDVIFSLCDSYLASHRFKEVAGAPIEKDIFKTFSGKTFTRKQIQQSYMAYAFDGPGIEGNNAIHQCALSCFGKGAFSMLFQEIREKLGLCYGIGIYQYPLNRDKGFSFIYAQIQNEKRRLAKSRILELLDEVKEKGFTKKLFDCAKAKLLSEWCYPIDDPKLLARKTAKLFLFGLEVDYQKEYDEILALDFDEVNNYAREYFGNLKGDWFIMNPKK